MKLKDLPGKAIRATEFDVLHAHYPQVAHLKKGDAFADARRFGIRHFGDPLGKTMDYFNISHSVHQHQNVREWFDRMAQERKWYDLFPLQKGNGSPTITFVDIHAAFTCWKQHNSIR